MFLSRTNGVGGVVQRKGFCFTTPGCKAASTKVRIAGFCLNTDFAFVFVFVLLVADLLSVHG